MRGIDTNYYFTKKYVLLDLYLLGRRNNKKIRAKIIREVYLIDGLKIKILLGTNIINLKKINIITLRNEAYIKLYNITVSINLKLRSRDITIKLVVAKKEIILLPRS